MSIIILVAGLLNRFVFAAAAAEWLLPRRSHCFRCWRMIWEMGRTNIFSKYGGERVPTACWVGMSSGLALE